MQKERPDILTEKHDEISLSVSMESKSLGEAINSLRNAAFQLEESRQNIPRHLLWIGSWGAESHAIMNAAALRYIQDKATYVSDAEIISGIRYLAARRYSILAGIIPNILLVTSAAGKIALDGASVSEIINSMRFITERFIVLRSIIDQTRPDAEFNVSSYEDFTSFEESVFDSAIGTRFDWSKAGLKFEDMGKKTEYDFSDDNVSKDLSRKNILTLRDKVGRSFPGLVAYYNYCSEFIHPNMGDLEAVGLDLRLLKANDGHLLRHRQLATVPKLMSSLQAARKGSEGLLVECILYSSKIISAYRVDSQKIISKLTVAERWIEKEIHRLVKHNRRGLDPKDLCPCGSGKTIKQCRSPTH